MSPKPAGVLHRIPDNREMSMSRERGRFLFLFFVLGFSFFVDMLFDRLSVNDNILSVLCTFNVGYERKFFKECMILEKQNYMQLVFILFLEWCYSIFYFIFVVIRYCHPLDKMLQNIKLPFPPNSFYTIL